MLKAYPSLLITKLYIPRSRASHIARAHLLAALEAGLERKLILIAAAAGFGKTTLLADWSRQHPGNIAWLSLDEGDNDPTRFLSYVIAALQTCRPNLARELLAALQSASPPGFDNALQSFINQIAITTSPGLILVIDDYHLIENQAIHAGLSFLLEHLPPQMTIVLLTRTDPPLPLGRLRAQNNLLELRATALRFSLEETSGFLNQTMRLQLSDAEIAILNTRVEGWIAGLQLAALAIPPQHAERQEFIPNFGGSNRFVLDYLMEEVLSQQPENLRQFLLQTSILRRMNGSLCSAVTGEAEGQTMLEQLEKNNLFLIPLDQSRTWYRYHHLFADLLQARLQAEAPTMLTELRQRAANWYEQNGSPEEAVSYALAAQNFDHAAQIILGSALGVGHRGEVGTLLDWYRKFPLEFVTHQPRLSLHFGIAFALNGRWDEAETLLVVVEQHPSDVPLGESLFLYYMVASVRRDTARLDTVIAAAEAYHQPDRLTKLALGLLLSMKGDLRRTCDLMAEVQEASERAGDLSMTLTASFHLCRFLVYRGNLRQAYRLSQSTLERTRSLGESMLAMTTFAHVSLGRILIEWNELDKAARHLSEAIRLAELTGLVIGMLSSSTMMLAEVAQGQGDTVRALETAQAAIAYAEQHDPPPEVFWLKAYQTRIWLTQGNRTSAGKWLAELENQPEFISMFYPNTIQTITQIRVLLAQRKTQDAITLLTQLTEMPPDLLTVETLALLALARQSQGDSVHALLALEQALPFAEAENRVRVFLDLGTPMTKLLAQYCEAHPDHSYAHKLLSAFHVEPQIAQSIDPLSERELDVLRLIVAGYSNEEIAQSLTLAISTVKWYVNTLYGKLHVKSRSQAIARTHELKLLLD